MKLPACYLPGFKLILSCIRLVLGKAGGPAVASILGHLIFKIILCMQYTSPHMILASGPIQSFRAPIDEAIPQPDGKEGHQGHLSDDVVGDHVGDGGHGDEDAPV